MEGTLRYGDTLADAVLPGGNDRVTTIVRDVVLILAGAGFVALSAQVSIPWYPVPFTGQTFAVLLVAGLLGAWRATSSLGLYALVGLLGAPVFADAAGGLSVLTGPTGGYIIGFIVAGAVVGYLCERGADRRFLSMVGVLLLGEVIIFAIGAWWLAETTIPGADARFGWSAAYQLGVEPFLLGDLFKLGIAAALLPAGWAGVEALGIRRGRRSKDPNPSESS
jgi:biotin transport system substrate-specific component